MTPMQFGKIMMCSDNAQQIWYGPFTEAMEEFGIRQPLEQAAFLAQCGHECGSLNKFEENMNYGPAAMMASWPTRFPTVASCSYYMHSPERLANQVYGGRFGNGAYVSGDGWKYRGRGPIQITFADAYRACGKVLNLSLIEKPEQLLDPIPGARSACWFWRDYKHCNQLPDLKDVVAVTKRIQGGDNGLADRSIRFHAACAILGV